MQQEQQPPLRDLSIGMSICLSTMSALNRTVQIWSRKPGTTGSWFFAVYFIFGSLIQSWYCQVNEDAGLYRDWVPRVAILGLSLVWFAVHGIAHAWFCILGFQFHSYDPGEGILDSLFAKWSSPSATLASDLIVSMVMSIALLLLQSPILSGWYAAMCIWLLFVHFWLVARDAHRKQIWVDSQVEADTWSKQIQRRP